MGVVVWIFWLVVDVVGGGVVDVMMVGLLFCIYGFELFWKYICKLVIVIFKVIGWMVVGEIVFYFGVVLFKIVMFGFGIVLIVIL